MLDETGATVSREQPVGTDRIMDLVISTANGSHIWLDVGISADNCEEMEAEKLRTYRAAAVDHDASFFPIIFNTEGKPTTRTKDAIQRLACEVDLTVTTITSTIVAAIVRGNGLVVSKAEAHMRTALARARRQTRAPPAQTAPPEEDTPRTTHAEPDPEEEWRFRTNNGTVRDDDEFAVNAALLASSSLESPVRQNAAFTTNNRDEHHQDEDAVFQAVLNATLYESRPAVGPAETEAIQATLLDAPPLQGEVCSVCMEDIVDGPVSRPPCQHIFHYECAENWFRLNNACPNCRAPLRSRGSFGDAA